MNQKTKKDSWEIEKNGHYGDGVKNSINVTITNERHSVHVHLYFNDGREYPLSPADTQTYPLIANSAGFASVDISVLDPDNPKNRAFGSIEWLYEDKEE